ncbi:MAG TPA: dethiobiotin synthase [Terriglobia bacterium]|nr:dethiobiotin synthase [Terriglobia bacterium]
MFRGLFITGTDTNVGKTTVAAAVLARYGHLPSLKYWKPIQTGIEIDDDTRTVLELSNCPESRLHLSGIRLERPVAPYLAAELSGRKVTIAEVMTLIEDQPKSVRWVAEGAGGVLVPLNESESMVDLMAAFGMPVLITARSSLGTINHTLLTLEAVRRRRLEPVGVVIVGPTDAANREAIERFGSVSVVDEIPHFDRLTPETFVPWATSAFDRDSRLERYFR